MQGKLQSQLIKKKKVVCCRYLLTMPAYAQKSGSLAVKLITLYSENSSKGLPSHQGVVLLFDAPTGSVQAVCMSIICVVE